MGSKELDLKAEIRELLMALGVNAAEGPLRVHSPISGEEVASVAVHDAETVEATVGAAHAAFLLWRDVPAPRRGELVRLLGEELRAHKTALGRLVSIEVGKSVSEGLGEVQEMIDICDFAVGLSRQLYGLTIATERPDHRMMETWHPLGVTGIISAFNFPVAVWAWNAALALVCGNAIVWKPSEKAPISALAVQALLNRVLVQSGAPDGLAGLVIGGREVGEALVDDPRVPLVSATGSTEMGRKVGQRLAGRFGRAILELGGNNAAIVTPSADLDLALHGVAFAAMGTAGQRCTTLRRLFVHETIYDGFVARLKSVYASVSVGNPLVESNLVGPLIDGRALESMRHALETAAASGGVVTGGERVEIGGWPDAAYVRPAMVEMASQDGPVLQETFAPILYVMRYTHLADAIALNNAVSQGLSSSIFTTNMREAERFLSGRGSDCGIANVNIGTSGAEIGGAFGGEKETGGGRESGSDSWKAYMRRATNTINYGATLPLAQGVTFDVNPDHVE
ncbi:aldehyde dehydrogenase family protein [Sphingosinicella microcystinivorans]|uniref:aldehyde dehydrogenase (NAD(+)) n=1 Tax=Sphingosinicella microcystinivorans TaxID=335406 RepID=A0AAD1D5T2_SPHMI|nr:aldehyde dehydrogenase family protein [Sphingosinicella microcystinivorans]RKS91384.1 aldehyde dehydrogenase (NAD+) [Sphingosinicella microcystinivorans]BBE34357.1 aldehyde dehydrogenase [Sphingosinicella microcystinivorans]